MNGYLQAKSDEFASRLTNLIRGCVADAPKFGVVQTSRVQQLHIGPLPFSPDRSGFSFIPLARSCDAGQCRLLLKIEFRVSLDEVSEFLAVQHSTYGLWVRPDPTRKPRPVFRVEYDRDAHNKPPAHVHLHAESLEFGWIYGTAGLPPPRLSEIHFPVGGRRFRPTVEEFLRFLDREQLFSDWRSGWGEIVQMSLIDWEWNQARATVRQHPEAATDQLRRMGYEILSPPLPEAPASSD